MKHHPDRFRLHLSRSSLILLLSAFIATTALHPSCFVFHLLTVPLSFNLGNL
jgi:hypothetical protein